MGIPDPNSKVPDPKLTQYIDELDPDKQVTGKKNKFGNFQIAISDSAPRKSYTGKAYRLDASHKTHTDKCF